MMAKRKFSDLSGKAPGWRIAGISRRKLTGSASCRARLGERLIWGLNPGNL
jgi:hypothetical protein